MRLPELLLKRLKFWFWVVAVIVASYFLLGLTALWVIHSIASYIERNQPTYSFAAQTLGPLTKQEGVAASRRALITYGISPRTSRTCLFRRYKGNPYRGLAVWLIEGKDYKVIVEKSGGRIVCTIDRRILGPYPEWYGPFEQ
jgi:hypothetical protein